MTRISIRSAGDNLPPCAQRTLLARCLALTGLLLTAVALLLALDG